MRSGAESAPAEELTLSLPQAEQHHGYIPINTFGVLWIRGVDARWSVVMNIYARAGLTVGLW